MNSLALLTFALLSVSGLMVALALATALRRAVRVTYERRRAARAAAIRPALLALAAGDDSDDIVVQLDVPDRVLERAVSDVLPRIRGEARDSVVALMEQRGFVDRVLDRARGRGAVRRSNAAETLGWMAVPRTLPTLVLLLQDRSREVVQVAARALGRMEDPAAVPFLLAALETHGQITPGQTAAALRHLGGDVAARLSEAIDHDNSDVRLVAVQVLGLVGTAGSVDRLSVALLDTEPAVRVGAAYAMGHIGGPRAIGPLVSALRSPDARMRAAAASALGEIGDPHAITALVEAIGDAAVEVGRAACYALAQIGPEGRVALELPAAHFAIAAEALVVSLMGLQHRVRSGVSSLALPTEVA